MEKSILKIIITYSLIGGVWFSLADFALENIDQKVSGTLKGFLFAAGIILTLRMAMKHLKRLVPYGLKYWQAFLMCFAVSWIAYIFYRLYCLVMYQDVEVNYLIGNYQIFARAFIVSVLISLSSALRYKSKKPEGALPKEIEEMFDVNMKEKP